MAESQRLYVTLDRLEAKMDANRDEVIQRLTRLEATQPKQPCSFFIAHKEEHKKADEAKTLESVKSLAKECARTIAAAITGALAAIGLGGHQ